MRLSLDTNVLWPVLNGPSTRGQALAAVLDAYNVTDDLIACAHVYAELIAAPSIAVATIDAMFARTGITTDWALSKDTWIMAGQTYRAYAQRRRATNLLVEPRRILADFVIGAHALLQADALLTYNQSDFKTNFPALRIIVPTA